MSERTYQTQYKERPDSRSVLINMCKRKRCTIEEILELHARGALLISEGLVKQARKMLQEGYSPDFD